VKQIREALNNMPDDLDSSYDEVMERINRQGKRQRELSWRALCWVTNAKRPLSPAEMTEALAIDTAGLDRDNLFDMETILSVCAGLVVVTDTGSGGGVIRLVHYTVQDYLERRQQGEFPRILTDITMTCISYLSFELPKTHGSFHDNSFLDYAVDYCLIHARGHPENSIKTSILSFLANCSAWLGIWNKRQARTGTLPTSASSLWIAAYFSLEEISQYLLQTEGAGGVLQQAVYCGHTAVVRILLKYGADINATDTTSGKAMDVALASRYSHGIFRLLIEHGADANSAGENGTPLHRAAHHNDYSLCLFLIEHSADVHSLGGTGHTALYTAASCGHREIIRLLLSSSANINAKGGLHGTALIAAAINGHRETVRFLLAHGADVNATGLGSRGVTALYAATAGGHDQIGRLLIKHGADENGREKSGLSGAVRIRSEKPKRTSSFHIGAYQPSSTLTSTTIENHRRMEEMERERDRGFGGLFDFKDVDDRLAEFLSVTGV
jgi:ankyrin repeat protein